MTRWRIQAIVLDFDGVLVDSNGIKRDAFFEALGPSYHAATRRALTRGRELPRHALLQQILGSHGLRGGALQEEVARYANRYSTAVTRAIVSRGLVRGTRPLLKRLAGRYPLYVSSTTPHRELLRLLRRLGVHSVLHGAFGWPYPKPDVIRRVATDHRAGTRNIVFVGDGRSDRRAASLVGCRFVGIANAFNAWTHDPRRNQVRSLRELPDLLERRSFSARRCALSSR